MNSTIFSALGGALTGSSVSMLLLLAKATLILLVALGITLTMQRAVQNMVELAGLPIEMVIPLATEIPARILGVSDRKGKIAAGYDADLVILTPKFEVPRVFVRGRELA